MLKRTSIIQINSILEKNLKWKILDVGCGTGKQSIYFQKKIDNSGKLFAFDKSKLSIKILNKKNKSKNNKFFSGDMNNIERINKKYLLDIKFDLISTVYSVYYAKKPLELIKFLIKKLDNKGMLVIFLPIKRGSKPSFQTSLAIEEPMVPEPPIIIIFCNIFLLLGPCKDILLI